MLWTANGREDKFAAEPSICDPAYADYESCENFNVIKKWVTEHILNKL